MKIAIVGLGGVGGYLAAQFIQAGLDVVGFARGEHLHTIKKNKLCIIEDNQTYSVALPVYDLDEADGIYDVVFFCIKSYDLLTSYERIKKHLSPKSILVPFLNGVDHGERLREVSESVVLDGAIYILSHIQEYGIIRKEGAVFAAIFGGETQAVLDVAALFERANLRYKIPKNIKEALWKKYIFIAAFASLTSYYNLPIRAIYENHYDEAKALLCEIAAVGKYYGVDLNGEIEKSLQIASKLPKDATTSMHKDFQENKQTELESLSGFIAKTQEVSTPLMQKYYEALR